MLGIRRYRGVAIDLFQGEPDLFVADAWVDLREKEPAQYGAELEAALAALALRSSRHVTVRPELVDEAEAKGDVRAERARASMDAVRRVLDGADLPGSGHLRRITFMLPDKAWYLAFRESLFASFADTP